MQYGGFAEVYDRLMVPDFDYDAWSLYIGSIFSEFSKDGKSIQNVLDCACGTGLLTLRLKKAGYNMTGLDLSDEMLSIAAENARSFGVRMPFVKMDMCSLAVHRPQDAIISTCDGVNYLDSLISLQKFFESAYKSLVPGGILCFDISTRHKLENVLGNNTFTEDTEDLAYIWRNTYDALDSLCEMELTLFIREGDRYRRVYESHIQRAHSLDEIDKALEHAGFSEFHAFDAYTFDKPRNDSERIQIVAIK